MAQNRHLLTAALAALRFGWLVAFTASTLMFGQTSPQNAPTITPPSGSVAYLTAHAVGTQNYLCLPSAGGAAPAWTFVAPQATLSVTQNRFTQQVSTHFLSPVPTSSPAGAPGCTLSGSRQMNCPTWQSSLDSSAVWGSKVSSLNAGVGPGCPNAGAIPCLLLKAVSNQPGSSGGGLFSRATYIQRLNTSGGIAPAGNCKVGDLALVPYSADYTFYTAEREQAQQSAR